MTLYEQSGGAAVLRGERRHADLRHVGALRSSTSALFAAASSEGTPRRARRALYHYPRVMVSAVLRYPDRRRRADEGVHRATNTECGDERFVIQDLDETAPSSRTAWSWSARTAPVPGALAVRSRAAGAQPPVYADTIVARVAVPSDRGRRRRRRTSTEHSRALSKATAGAALPAPSTRTTSAWPGQSSPSRHPRSVVPPLLGRVPVSCEDPPVGPRAEARRARRRRRRRGKVGPTEEAPEGPGAAKTVEDASAAALPTTRRLPRQ